jgi:hypothetical protein
MNHKNHTNHGSDKNGIAAVRASDVERWPAGPDRNAGRANSEPRNVATAVGRGALND